MVPKDISGHAEIPRLSVVVPSCNPRASDSEPSVSQVVIHLELHARASQRSTRRKRESGKVETEEKLWGREGERCSREVSRNG